MILNWMQFCLARTVYNLCIPLPSQYWGRHCFGAGCLAIHLSVWEDFQITSQMFTTLRQCAEPKIIDLGSRLRLHHGDQRLPSSIWFLFCNTSIPEGITCQITCHKNSSHWDNVQSWWIIDLSLRSRLHCWLKGHIAVFLFPLNNFLNPTEVFSNYLPPIIVRQFARLVNHGQGSRSRSYHCSVCGESFIVGTIHVGKHVFASKTIV